MGVHLEGERGPASKVLEGNKLLKAKYKIKNFYVKAKVVSRGPLLRISHFIHQQVARS